MKTSRIKLLFVLISGSSLIFSCEENQPIEQNIVDEKVLDPSNSLNTVFDGKIFSIPSPIQTAYLIKDLNLTFDGALGNDVNKHGDYITEYQQALNLGIYGADLGYSALYDQKNNTLQYLAAVQNLTTELGLDVAFNSDFLENFESNTEDEKKMIFLMSEAFKQADNFLKNANRKSTSALVLTGGWVESVYFACQLNLKNPNKKIETRIGEQKQTIGTIIAILEEYNEDELNNELIEKLHDLKLSFDNVMISYNYIAPETDKESKTTTFLHETEIIIEAEVLKEIESKIDSIRNLIINPQV